MVGGALLLVEGIVLSYRGRVGLGTPPPLAYTAVTDCLVLVTPLVLVFRMLAFATTLLLAAGGLF